MGKKQKIPASDIDTLAMTDGDIEPVTLPDGRPGVGLTVTSEIMRGKAHSGEFVQQFYVLDPGSCPMLADLPLRAGRYAATNSWPKEDAPQPYGTARPKNGTVTLNS